MSLPESLSQKMSADAILQIDSLKKYFPVRKGLLLRRVGDVKAVDGVSFSLKRGETLGIVGESGCGKSTLGRTIVRLYDPTEGSITFKGEDLHQLGGSSLREARKEFQMIFQDPYSSLNPRKTVASIVQEPMDIHKVGTQAERRERVRDLFRKVGLKPETMNRYPHEFSGGQRQRISIARAIALEPELIVADEPVSALDVSIQAQVLNLMKALQKEMGITFVFISHDLSVIEHFCDSVAVMYLGKIVEMAPREELYANPKHPYTQALIRAIPVPGKGKKAKRETLEGEVPSPINPPSGCPFHPRCAMRTEGCDTRVPVLSNLNGSPDHQVSCHLYE
ncbi:UNVERIFIED_CONTAM: hypothetical protein GTU68_039712 [Idotea baltica]|nr:hypothetical protein [Idotea baltica]